MVMVHMCVLTVGDGVCVCVLPDGERVETGCDTENESMDFT